MSIRTQSTLLASFAAVVLVGGCAAGSDDVDEAMAGTAAGDGSVGVDHGETDGSAPDDGTEGDGGGSGEAAADGLGASQEQPVPLGQTGRVGQAAFGEWDIVVTDVDLDAQMSPTETPEEGRKRIELSITFTNLGTSATTPAAALNQNGAADAATSYRPLIDTCAVPTEVDFANPMLSIEPGESSDRLMCWYVDADNTGTLTVFFAPFYDEEQRLWFALN